MHRQVLATLGILCLLAAPLWADTDLKKLLAQMSWREKLGQLTQYAGSSTGPVPLTQGIRERVGKGEVGSVLSIAGVKRCRELQKEAVEQSRLGIPLVFAYDVIHGYRTVFPIPLAEAAGFDPGLAEETARAAALEATATGIHWNFAPMVDIARDPRWGRIIEGAGEDTYLGEVMARARVRGFQGKDLSRPDTMAACAKHFAGYGAAEGGRDYHTAEISERTLREVYLPPFNAALDEGAATVMAGFQEVAGVPAHASVFLLDQVLRQEWKFEGLVVSDYNAIRELLAHGVAGTPQEAGVLALQAGVDMDMMGDIYRELPETPAHRAWVDRSVMRVLELKKKLGLFEDPYRYLDEKREKQQILNPEFRKLARRAAGKSAVLLRNDQELLPLSKSLKKIAVVGPLANDRRTLLGAWNTAGREEDVVSILQGIKSAWPQAEVNYYERAFNAVGSDVVVLVTGEHWDLSGESRNRTNIELPSEELALVRQVKALELPTVVVLVTGRPLDLTDLDFGTQLLVWHPGSEGGNAVADLLLGEENPGGKLPVTFPRSGGQIPLYYNAKRSGRPAQKGVHRYTLDYLDESLKPLYPFGHGLSYTSFAYSDLKVESADLPVKVSVEVQNVGARTGDEVVQLYLRDPVRSITPPLRELRGFQRLTLAPGQKQRVEFSLDRHAFSFIGHDNRWTFEKGKFELYVGGDSLAELKAELEL